ncbi:DUF262 domain-containing protein [Inquilinus limosus]|uniref:DUF262 domain-containing protein n=1 Tax=Inquilinus limosus TaxID=171674 RepID=UPI003F1386B9
MSSLDLDKEISAARLQIQRTSIDLSIGELISMHRNEELIINPEYQRLFRWDEEKKINFIESILVNIPIPPIFVFSDENGRWELVDGLQRVSTILQFTRSLKTEQGTQKGFSLSGTRLVESFANLAWPSIEDEATANSAEDDFNSGILPYKYRLEFRRSRLRVEVLGPGSDPRTKYELFKRLNTGGAILQPQEVRSCVIASIDPSFLKIIDKFKLHPAFTMATKLTEEKLIQQLDRELVIRFLVLRNVPFKKDQDVHDYLDNGIIDVISKGTEKIESEHSVFQKTFDLIFETIGEGAFRQMNEKGDLTGQFLVARFEFIVLGLSRFIEKRGDGLPDKDKLKGAIARIEDLEETKRYSGSGVRGSRRLDKFVFSKAEAYFEEKLA